jgi:hypothetical protein
MKCGVIARHTTLSLLAMTTSRPSPLPLDDDGLLPPGSLVLPPDAATYLVFAQTKDARLDIAAWKRHAQQFYCAELHLTRPKEYGPSAPETDGAHIVLTHGDRPALTRTVFLVPRTDADLACAERAEGGGGLALLAKRCTRVVLVVVETGPEEDHDALLLCAIIAGIVLGPILSPDRRRIFGAKTARLEVEKRAR